MREARRADIMWTGTEVESYERLKQRTLRLQKNVPRYVKEMIEAHLDSVSVEHTNADEQDELD